MHEGRFVKSLDKLLYRLWTFLGQAGLLLDRYWNRVGLGMRWANIDLGWTISGFKFW
jgi:hypothetical protein